MHNKQQISCWIIVSIMNHWYATNNFEQCIPVGTVSNINGNSQILLVWNWVFEAAQLSQILERHTK